MLHRINGELVEHLSYPEVTAKILRSKSPHFAEFLRYDYRFNPFSGVWNSLEELRQEGVCVEDPLFARLHFVNIAATGKVKQVRDLLLSGEDPNSCDLSGNTALVMAAANKYPEVVELLVNAGADVNCRDKNVSCVCVGIYSTTTAVTVFIVYGIYKYLYINLYIYWYIYCIYIYMYKPYFVPYCTSILSHHLPSLCPI